MTSPVVIPKNGREEIRITREDFNNHDLVQIRVWYDDGSGTYKPGKQGVAFRADLLPEVLAALGGLLATEETAT